MVKLAALFLLLILSCQPTAEIRQTRFASSRTENCQALQTAVNGWLGVPYLYGGEDRNGLDCSSFTQHIFYTVYAFKLPRTTGEQFAGGQPVRPGFLHCGDLVFFKNVRGRGVDHTGVYLGGQRLAHASTTQGVVISRMDNPYYIQRYVGAVRYSF